MKSLYLGLVASLTLIFLCPIYSFAQEQEPLRADWLARDYQSVGLISLLASSTPLTPQRIGDILGDGNALEEDELGFGATTFDIARGNGYTTLYVEGFAFRGSIGFYKVGIRASAEQWPGLRELIVDLWKQNGGPTYHETGTGLVHTQTNDEVFLAYKSSVVSELGEMKTADVPEELKKSFDYLTSPIGVWAIGDRHGKIAIDALVNAKRVDLIENVLKGFNPRGRVYAALALLRLSKDNRLVLSSDMISTIAKVINLALTIRTVSGCIVSSRTAQEILSEPHGAEP